ncbi:hypothetical protein FHT86_000869 [Rhizobium sp. BK313]|uniref:hypothetical protein n=1 Tax=Rhizobium sp. BK313 TaxID=2587081 RepID=UPI0010604DB1|nr:hypothetical protein [Rhizobium sp. BK313]MBB3452613.1 hypothetical protein [Rhizobium sp. BK313]
MSKRLDELADLVRDIDARCQVQELFIAQLLARVGMVTGDPHLFVNGVMQLVANDFKEAAAIVTNKDDAQRTAYALESFAKFATMMQQAIEAIPEKSVN